MSKTVWIVIAISALAVILIIVFVINKKHIVNMSGVGQKQITSSIIAPGVGTVAYIKNGLYYDSSGKQITKAEYDAKNQLIY